MLEKQLIFPLPSVPIANSTKISCSGYCEKCGKTHTFPEGKARDVALHLFDSIDRHGSIDLLHTAESCDPRFSTAYLYSQARGQMFGVMTVIDKQGREGYIRAFSGQYNSIWSVPGWIPPLISQSEFEDLTHEEEKKIKLLGKTISELGNDHAKVSILKKERRKLSSQLMARIHDLFILHNFRGKALLLREAALTGAGLPTGTGECCAPKLLNFAACNELKPTGIAEFYFGKENRSGSKKHGTFYPSCAEKCSLILGFLLCGLQK